MTLPTSPDASDRTPVSVPAGMLRGWLHVLDEVRGDDVAAVAEAIRAVLGENERSGG